MDEAGTELHADAELERLFRQHAGFVQRVLRRFGVAASDVADASQDVFLVVQRKLPEFEQRAAVTTWLYRISARVASDYRKRAHRRYERCDEPLDARGVAEEQEQRASEHQLAARIERALDRLCDDQRQVFVLYELEELHMSEVAATLGCPLKTAFSRLYAARRELRADLTRAGYTGIPVLAAFTPWKAHAAAELRTALDALFGSGGAIAPHGVAGVIPAAQVSALAHVAAAGAALNQACAVVSATSLLVVAAFGLPRLAPEPGATLLQVRMHGEFDDAALARAPRYRLTPPHAQPPLPLEPAPAPTPARSTRVRRAISTPAPVPVPVPVPAPASASAASLASPSPALAPEPARWIRAPEPTKRAQPEATRASAVGLDEVLAATSVEPLMRFAADGRGARPARFALVPERARAARNTPR